MAEDAATTVAPAAQTTAQSTVNPSPKAEADPGDGSMPAWVAKRLEQKERAVWREAGFANAEEAKATKAERDALKEATKSAEQKAADRVTELEKAAAERDELKKDLADYAEAALAKLPEDERAFILEAAPRSPAKQLRLVEKYVAMQAKKAANSAAAATTTEPAKQPRPAPASTTAAGNAPAAASTSPVNHRAEYERLKSTNEWAAMKYLRLHKAEIFATPPTTQ